MSASANSNTSLAAALAARLSPGSRVLADEPMARRTTLRIGGPADLYVEPADEDDLARTLQFCRAENLAVFMLGRGSNILVQDGGFRGVMVCLSHPAFSRIEIAGARIVCGAGARLKVVTHEARRNGITGLEFLEGIPGSVGGALRMNAGAMGAWIMDVVESVRCMDFDGHATEVPRAGISVQYRKCSTLAGCAILSATLQGRPGDHQEILDRMNEYGRKRRASQPAAPSAGCIFKNPETVPAGRLIDEMGLKGVRSGGAMVSLEHANFIVNDGSARAADVLDLVENIRRHAREERGIQLEMEVEVVGEPEARIRNSS
jgi:UDP-N-acetylenolpyruvoylglucosamine reductase